MSENAAVNASAVYKEERPTCTKPVWKTELKEQGLSLLGLKLTYSSQEHVMELRSSSLAVASSYRLMSGDAQKEIHTKNSLGPRTCRGFALAEGGRAWYPDLCTLVG